MIDIDHFKGINDRFGHKTGDMALCMAVERMQDSIRGIDVMGRWGGEEFVVLLPHSSPESALVVAERLRGNLAKTALPAPSSQEYGATQPLHLTVSVGVATYAGPGDDLQHMLHRADVSLYKAKAAGRNRVLAMPAVHETRTPQRSNVNAKAS
jgi:diguanylate cyclase (GGDEF)-like protein